MTQEQALDIMKIGKNIFLTGGAGTGKTYVLNEYIRYLREHDVSVALTASTVSTVIAQAPRLAPHREAMAAVIAQALGIGRECVNVKAKTAEKLGPVGQGQSIEARAIAFLYR